MYLRELGVDGCIHQFLLDIMLRRTRGYCVVIPVYVWAVKIAG